MTPPQKPEILTDAEWAAWPKCAIPACLNKCCLRLKSIYCWPHTPGVNPDEVAGSIEYQEEAAHGSY